MCLCIYCVNHFMFLFHCLVALAWESPVSTLHLFISARHCVCIVCDTMALRARLFGEFPCFYSPLSGWGGHGNSRSYPTNQKSARLSERDNHPDFNIIMRTQFPPGTYDISGRLGGDENYRSTYDQSEVCMSIFI
jgi:hypothetical protein